MYIRMNSFSLHPKHYTKTSLRHHMDLLWLAEVGVRQLYTIQRHVCTSAKGVPLPECDGVYGL